VEGGDDEAAIAATSCEEDQERVTHKQATFCREYIVDCNGTQAAIRAGFSERTAQEQASQMLALPHIEAEVRRL